MFRRIFITLVLVLIVSGAVVAWVWWRAEPKPIGSAYAAMGGISLWDGTGPVRRQVESLSYGESLVVLGRYGNSVEVRTPHRKIGWVNSGDLVDPAVWQRLGELAAKVRVMHTQAVGHTSVLSNVRIDPGLSSPRVGQLRANTPVEILGRAVSDQHDWMLVRAKTRQIGQIAGWVFGDFIADDPPSALVPYLSSSGMKPVAWFALRKVEDHSRGSVPNYLMAGTDKPEGSACDFDMLRVYTWSPALHQYATAFVQNNLCGQLPVQLTFESGPQKIVLFRFQDLHGRGHAALAYRMQDTIVRPIRP